MNEKFEFEVVVIGAGIVGLAIAYELSKTFNKILVIEKESTFGKHVSSRNSEVIHSGIYYKPNSLKARLCVEGNNLIYKFAKKYNINYKNCGKFILASNNNDLYKLDNLYSNGINNGLFGLKKYTSNKIKNIEPLIKSSGGLWIPSSGIIDSHALMKRLVYLIQSNNSIIMYNHEAIDILKDKSKYTISIKNVPYTISSSILINSSGLWSDKIADMIGIKKYKINFCKGVYYKTFKYRNQINSLIYPLPTNISLGIHVVLRLDGSIGFGPNAYYVDNIDYNFEHNYKKIFLQEINKYLYLKEDDLLEDFSGIRPKTQGINETNHDFTIINETKRGFNNFINLIGIESPGLTSCFAIAKYVKTLIN